jgi:hypothetical protein
MSFGLGNFLYDFSATDKGDATFTFRDPEDASNTAEVSVSQSDFPAGVTQPDSRQVADVAYAQCAKVLNDKRDARIRKEAADDLSAKHEADANAREVGADFLANAQDVATAPASTEKDGTQVYNTKTDDASDTGKTSESKK